MDSGSTATQACTGGHNRTNVYKFPFHEDQHTALTAATVSNTVWLQHVATNASACSAFVFRNHSCWSPLIPSHSLLGSSSIAYPEQLLCGHMQARTCLQLKACLGSGGATGLMQGLFSTYLLHRLDSKSRGNIPVPRGGFRGGGGRSSRGRGRAGFSSQSSDRYACCCILHPAGGQHLWCGVFCKTETVTSFIPCNCTRCQYEVSLM